MATETRVCSKCAAEYEQSEWSISDSLECIECQQAPLTTGGIGWTYIQDLQNLQRAYTPPQSNGLYQTYTVPRAVDYQQNPDGSFTVTYNEQGQ